MAKLRSFCLYQYSLSSVVCDVHKNLIISPGLKIVQKAFSDGLIFGGAYLRRDLLLEGILDFKMVLA